MRGGGLSDAFVRATLRRQGSECEGGGVMAVMAVSGKRGGCVLWLSPHTPTKRNENTSCSINMHVE